MKNLLYVFFVILLFTSCEKDESKNPLATIVDGSFARLEISNKLLNFADLQNTSFGGSLTTPGNKIVKYDLYVRYSNNLGYISNNYVFVKSISTFPTELKITPAELAIALNLNLSNFKQGDKFRFLAYTTDTNGIITDYNSLSSVVKTQPSMMQGYKFVTALEVGSNLTGLFDNYEL